MVLLDYFSKIADYLINNELLVENKSTVFQRANQYIDEIIAIPFPDYLSHIKGTGELPYVLSSDVPQFSNIDSATNRICDLLSQTPVQGFNFEQIGKILQPGRTDDVYANKKYGENHIKTAETLGLSFKNGHLYYLSAIGHIFPTLDQYKKEQLISRLALRNSFVYNVFYKILNGLNVSIKDEISFLSESTIKRRKNNCLILCNLTALNKDYPMRDLLNKIE